jgi:putative transposase
MDSASDVLKAVKGVTAHELRKKYPHLRKTPSLWTRSFFVSTAGNVSSETIRRYIDAQKGMEMIRTHILPCTIPRARADALNRSSGTIYTGILVAHYRTLRRKGIWLSEKSGTRWSDSRTEAGMHAHSIDAAQQGFYKACVTTRALRKAGIAEARFPHHRKKFRTTIWKNTGIKRRGDTLELSNGRKGEKLSVPIPLPLRDCLRFLEVRLVYDKHARRYTWHIVVENGLKPKPSPGDNVVSVDLGEIHPAVVGDKTVATIITCRERRHQSQGHAKRLAKISKAIARRAKGSRRRRRLVRAKVRMKAKHRTVLRDIEHKVSRAVVDAAIERKAGTIVIGDIRDVADGIDCGKEHNGRMSRLDHGKIRSYIEYKAAAEGIVVPEPIDEAYTTKTCPHCGNRHKPRGRTYRCPACGFQAHRDVVGQINILSRHLEGDVGRLPAPTEIKHRIPYNLRVMRRRCGHQPEGNLRSPGATPRNSG